MKISLIGITESILPNEGNVVDTPYEFCAKTMATCVSNDPIKQMTTELPEATQKRLERTLKERHHSGYDMFNLVFEFDDISKIFCMYLNNLHTYATEETSGRHKELTLTPKEKAVFDYFYDKFYNHVELKNPNMPTRQKKQIALENARYIAGVDAKTNITHSVSLRQINYIYNWAQDLINKPEHNMYEKLVLPDMKEFCKKLEDITILGEPILNPLLTDPYKREFNLFGDNKIRPEHFGTTYEVNYKASAVAVAQLQRHRPTYLKLGIPEEAEYYTPQIVTEMGIQDEWHEKIKSLNNVPQARLFNVNESGQLLDIQQNGTTGAGGAYIMKMKERCCDYAQEETRIITKEVANKIFEGLKEYDAELANELINRYGGDKNRRDFPDYKCICSHPCKPHRVDINIEQSRN